MPVIIHKEHQSGFMQENKLASALAWLIEHVGPQIAPVVTFEKSGFGGEFLRAIAAYLHFRGTTNLWEHYGRINTLTKIEGHGWTYFRGKAVWRGGEPLTLESAYDYVFHIDDAGLAYSSN